MPNRTSILRYIIQVACLAKLRFQGIAFVTLAVVLSLARADSTGSNTANGSNSSNGSNTPQAQSVPGTSMPSNLTPLMPSNPTPNTQRVDGSNGGGATAVPGGGSGIVQGGSTPNTGNLPQGAGNTAQGEWQVLGPLTGPTILIGGTTASILPAPPYIPTEIYERFWIAVSFWALGLLLLFESHALHKSTFAEAGTRRLIGDALGLAPTIVTLFVWWVANRDQGRFPDAISVMRFASVGGILPTGIACYRFLAVLMNVPTDGQRTRSQSISYVGAVFTVVNLAGNIATLWSFMHTPPWK
jgi:hypothetical protein